MNTQLDELMSEAFEANHPAMLDYINMKFKILELKDKLSKHKPLDCCGYNMCICDYKDKYQEMIKRIKHLEGQLVKYAQYEEDADELIAKLEKRLERANEIIKGI